MNDDIQNESTTVALQSRQVSSALLHWNGIPVEVTGEVKAHPSNWPLIDEGRAPKDPT